MKDILYFLLYYFIIFSYCCFQNIALMRTFRRLLCDSLKLSYYTQVDKTLHALSSSEIASIIIMRCKAEKNLCRSKRNRRYFQLHCCKSSSSAIQPASMSNTFKYVYTIERIRQTARCLRMELKKKFHNSKQN